MQPEFDSILSSLADGTVVPYLGAAALAGVIDPASGKAIPADSDSLILAMNDGRPMAPKLMYEFPRAAMNVELKRGRSALTRFLNTTYRDTAWSPSALHTWLAGLPGVKDVHDLHIWAIGTSRVALTAHLVMPAGHQGDGFLKDATDQLHRRFEITHVTLQVVEVPFQPACDQPARSDVPQPAIVITTRPGAHTH